MLRDRRVNGHFLRGAALVLLVAMASASAWLACGGDPAIAARSEVDPGPTYGLEVVVTVKGRGRVVSVPAAIDCPATCFARLVLAGSAIDGSADGLTLGAEENIGSHFMGWTLESVSLGVAARGPSQCSPMKRWTSVLPVATGSHFQVLHFGETEGTPPPGLEAECAPYTRVPLAYAITATFEENDVRPVPPPPPGQVVEVLFEPPALGVTVGKEIGVASGKVYWRFDRGVDADAFSGIASGKSDGSGGGSTVIVPPNDHLGRVLLGRTILAQHAGSGLTETIQTVTGVRTQFYLGPCLGFATDDVTAYCRHYSGSITYLVSWPVGTTSYSYTYQLPGGYGLAIDDQDVYFSGEQARGLEGAGYIDRAPRFPDGGGGFNPPAVTTRLVTNQSSPRDLVLGPSHLFWLDREPSNDSFPTSVARDGGTAQRGGFEGAALAVDPTSPSHYYIAQSSGGTGGWSIVKASATSAGDVKGFRFGLRAIGGIAVDATHVYWTGDDGRVYRAPKE